jgi:hypothetical protein
MLKTFGAEQIAIHWRGRRRIIVGCIGGRVVVTVSLPLDM